MSLTERIAAIIGSYIETSDVKELKREITRIMRRYPDLTWKHVLKTLCHVMMEKSGLTDLAQEQLNAESLQEALILCANACPDEPEDGESLNDDDERRLAFSHKVDEQVRCHRIRMASAIHEEQNKTF